MVHRPRRREQRPVHLHGRRTSPQQGADPRRRGLLRAAAPSTGAAVPGAAVPRLLQERARRRGHRLRRLRRRRQRPHRAVAPRRARALQGGRLVHGRRPLRPRPEPAPGGPTGGHRHREALRRRDPRVARLHERGRQAARGRQVRAAGRVGPVPLQPARADAAEAAAARRTTRRSARARWPTTRRARTSTAWRSPTTSSSTGSGAYLPIVAVDPAPRRCLETPPLGSAPFGLNGADSARQPGQPVLVPDDVEHPAGRTSTRSSRASRRSRSTARRPSTRRPAASTCTRSRPTRRYKRLTRTVDLTGKTRGALTFKVSYDTEPDFDYVFVEAHTVGQDDWTTLPDANGQHDARTRARAARTPTRSGSTRTRS